MTSAITRSGGRRLYGPQSLEWIGERGDLETLLAQYQRESRRDGGFIVYDKNVTLRLQFQQDLGYLSWAGVL